MDRIAIIGGGIAGLAAAYELQKSGRFAVSAYEAGQCFGGKLETVRERGCVIERAPDSVFTLKPAALDLMLELGLECELIEPGGNEFSMLIGGELHAIPRALATLHPTPEALACVSFLTEEEKARALNPSVGQTDGDVSVADFFRGRFGRRFSEFVAEPLLAGIHAGRPERLSMMALFPAYLRAGRPATTERALAPSSEGVRRATFVSLRGGMGVLADRLVERLDRVELCASTSVTAIRRDGAGLGLTLGSGTGVIVDHVILAVPAFAAAPLLQGLSPSAAQGLREIRHVSTAVVTLGYPRDAFPAPTGNGFLVPYGEPCAITGCTWTSNKWPNRAPANVFLMRVFLGRDGALDVDAMADQAVLDAARQAIQTIMAATAEPLFARLDRWPKAMPQYDLGHLDRISAIESALKGLPITLAGGSYRGTGIPDCIRQGRDAARAI